MSDAELCYLSLAEAGELIARRDLSPVSLVRAVLDRIERLDVVLGAYLTLMAESALSEAQKAELEIVAGRYRGPLHGIPVSLKDLIYVKGVRNTAGSRVLVDFVPGYDAGVVERLRRAGAVLLGKVQMYEFAMGPTTAYHYGPTRNPWDPRRVSEGSSSGSAVAVAAGLCHASLGTDTGGSIRGPAAACGVVGFKPTYGRVSRYGVLPLSWSLDHVGPIARTVRDCALVMDGIAGYDRRDPASLRARAPHHAAALEGELRGLRVGVPASLLRGLHGEIDACLRRALALLESAGATLSEVAIPSFEQAQVAYTVITLAESASVHEERIRAHPGLFGEVPRQRVEMGSLLLATDYLKAQRVRTLLHGEFAGVMKQVDVIVAPAAAEPPLRLGEAPPPRDGPAGAANPRRPFSMLGVPAVSVPCGFTSDGLPVGLQIAGRARDDELVLRTAYAYEQLAGWYKRHPPVERLR